MENSELMNVNSFSKIIEDLAEYHKEPLLDTIAWYCDQNKMELESAVKLISKTLKDKIELEAMGNRIFKKKAALPI
jgi:predicted CopG family antitoxin